MLLRQIMLTEMLENVVESQKEFCQRASNAVGGKIETNEMGRACGAYGGG
jgi:hypothetical protein